ncbi:Foldase protein PrsA [subsurface metagenome]
MPKLNKTSPGNNPAGKVPTSEKHTNLRPEAVDSRARKRKWTVSIIASVVIVLIMIIVGVSLYINSAPFRRIIITVDDTSINMDYFLKRTQLAGADAMEMLDKLTNEQLIKLEAPQYVGEVTPEDIDQALRIIAGGESETISESEFKEWYRQLLNEIDLSDSEYRDYIGTLLLTARLHEYLAERVPTVAEQVHLHSILLSTEDLEKITERWKEEEDLGELTAEIWQDKQSEEEAEDLGWMPRGVLPYGFDEVAFSLTIGDVSAPIAYVDYSSSDYDTYYYLLMVSEKADAREVDEDSLQILKAGVLDEWLSEEVKFHEVMWNYDSEIDAWINWQLTKE